MVKKKAEKQKPAKKGAREKIIKKRTGFSRLFYGVAVAVVWTTVLMVPLVIYYSYDLPDISNIDKATSSNTIMVMDRDGGTIATYGDVFGEWLEYEEIPVEQIEAIIATEDRRFFDHNGIDFRGLARAMFNNISEGRLVEGGSTISQQLAKNLYLSSSRTLKRKVQELLLSFLLEMRLSKQEILTIYMNRAYFGSGAYGIDAAARTIFGHSARDLSLTEAAMLAGMLKGPALYSPLRDVERAYDRTAIVLDNMVATEFIDQQTADSAKRDNVRINQNSGGNVRYFTDWIVEQLPDLIGSISEPIIIHTTMIPEMQQMAAGAVRQTLGRRDEENMQGALVSMDTDGAVRAMVGGRDYNESQFNRAVQAQRQPGSAFKLFVYLAALEAGYGPETMMRDSPIMLNGWAPKNYTDEYLGDVNLETAFAKSINTVAVKLSESVNRNNVINMSRRLGIVSPLTTEPSIALGASEVNLLELTAAYTVIARGGIATTPYGIVEIQNSAGQVLYRHIPEDEIRILDQEVAYTMHAMLQNVVATGTARSALMNFPVAGKTGTTQNYKDALFVGYGKNMINGVWVGKDDSTPMQGITGGSTPAHIWKNFMYRVDIGRNDATLETPNVSPRSRPQI
ncbi:transglycosylase domain-containing protein [Pseudemcibacter aquimaris]|uniref:transglycosylase domain-containing protein n=1 Tax=Pseudemcibacter aquimaris TaxID=2857064 RepID=UPI0020113275|nr:PBP1A family penicillin-binding protein [Pseudemcibacter aquimaris]MCC3861906.1 PBP1A family penicillin-binding protein [Pseudemcibacter aquimaris]WDU58658.1 PBP1A family penicillin-binding protein [Pseudemcibacter aquimaris]